MADTELRDQVAAALVAEMRRTIICPRPGGIGAIGGTEFDLADAALAVVQPELDRLREVEQVHQELTAVRAHPLITCAHNVRSVHIAALARKIAEKRDALAKLDEACREVDRLRAALRDAAQRIRTYGIDHVPDSLYDVVEELANLIDPEVPDGS